MRPRPTRGALAALAVALSGAACPPVRALPPPRSVPAGPAAAATTPGPFPEAPWERLAPRDLPLPLGDVAALRGAAAIVLAGGRIYRWEDGAARAVCVDFEPAPFAVRGDGDRFLVLGGEESAPTVWRSDDGGAHCTRVTLPSLLSRGALRGRLRPSLHGAVAMVYSTGGGIARSDDGGATWRRLPNLPGASEVHRGAGDATIAAARSETDLATARVALYRLPHPDAATWEPLRAGARHLPLELRLQDDGDVLLVDGAGSARIAPDGTLHDERAEPALLHRRDNPSVMVPAGPGQVVMASASALMTLDARGVEPFAVRPAGGDVAFLDANPEGVVWWSNGRVLFRGRVDEGVAPVTRTPLREGDARALLVAGSELVLIGSTGLVARSRDGGERWTESRLPDGFPVVEGVAFGRSGELVVASREGLAVADGSGFVRVDGPPEPAFGDPTARSGEASYRFQVVGDRWIVVHGGVYTSDDQGAHWTQRFGRDARSEAAVLAASLRGERALLVDQEHRVWLSTDAATGFERVGAIDAGTNLLGRAGLEPVIAWDGDARAALVVQGAVLDSRDGGATWTLSPGTRFGARSAFFAPDGRLMALFEVAMSERCSGSGGVLLAAEGSSRARFLPVPEACDHVFTAWSDDGGSLWGATAAGAIYRGNLRAIGRLAPR